MIKYNAWKPSVKKSQYVVSAPTHVVGHLLKIMKMLIYTSETASLVEVSILAFIKPVLQALNFPT